MKKRIQKARTAFKSLRNIWKATKLNEHTKLQLFNSNAKSIILYGSETWKLTKQNTKSLQTFVNPCLRQIKKIKWSDKVRNEDFWAMAGQTEIEKEIGRRKWKWIGHSLRRPSNNIARVALSWNPQGKRKRGRPRASWRRDLVEE